jgi:4-hydroxy-tetrahydrodipicolinate synthase
MIQGSIVALVTPMFEDGQLDWASLDKLVEWHVSEGTNAIVAVGTTGESATLSIPEHAEVIRRVVTGVAGRIPVIAGTGANNTQEAIELSRAAQEAGADACLSVTPYYNKPTQEGMYQHFKKIAASVAIPQILYNVPGRTSVDLSNDTAVRLAELDNIVGIKDATGDLSRGRELISRVPNDFAVYSGDDPTATELILAGGKGNISVTANVIPAAMAELCRAALAGDHSNAMSANERLMPLHSALFCESNPIPVKWAVAEIGKIAERGIRLPLTPLSEALQPQLRGILQEFDAV